MLCVDNSAACARTEKRARTSRKGKDKEKIKNYI